MTILLRLIETVRVSDKLSIIVCWPSPPYAKNVYAATIERLLGNENGNGKKWELTMWEWEGMGV